MSPVESFLAGASSVASSVIYNPVNLGLLVICGILIYKIYESRRRAAQPPPPREPELPPLRKHDMTPEELKQYDGKGPDGRVCVSVNGKVFDVTRNGKRFYGPDGPYSVFAGRDASRGLATFSVDAKDLKDGYDDLSDLNSNEMESIREWEFQFNEKYSFVGKLLRPGEEASEYDDEEDESGATSNVTPQGSAAASNSMPTSNQPETASTGSSNQKKEQ